MMINRDYFDNPIVPDYVLTKANRERIGVIKCTDKISDIKYNNLNTVSFTTYLYIDNEKNPCYEDIDIMKYILLPDIGFFYISDCKIHSDGTEFEYKEVTATSYEGLMGQKYIESFVINMGSTESIDDVQFYNIADKSKSLLHLVLEKCPGWKIGHIDPALVTMQRSFEIDKQDVYSFLMDDVASAFGCVFLFDTLTNTINIYQEKNMGEDTDIHVSYNNLLESTDISCSIDDIKTSLTITGSDDLTVREINMGNDNIINLDFYNSTDYMSQGLYDAYNKWVKLRSDNLDRYTSLLSQCQNYYKQINYLTHEKMPDDPESTDWTLYGLNPLIEKLTVYEQKQAVSMKAGHGSTDSNYYQSEYLPIYNTIIAINTQIEKIKRELNILKSSQDAIYKQMSMIISLVAMENNFTEKQLIELNTFIREDELNTDNFVVTDVMTDDERFDMLNQMLAFGEKELSKVSTPQLSFSVNMANIFSIPDFSKIYEKFDVGNYIWVTFRNDYNVKARLLTIHINYHDIEDFSVTFGNIQRKSKTRYTDISAKINAGVSAATSVSFNQSNWNKASKDADNINQMLADGLLSQGNYIATSTENSDFLIDKRGLYVNTTTGSYANKDSIFIGGGRILFTDDNWKTVSMSVGRADVTINGVTESRFGTFADFVIAGYVGGSILEGSEILGGVLKSTNYVAGKTGSIINLNDGTFEFYANNEKKLTLDLNGVLTVKGTIQADLGYIGGKDGFTIMSGKLYSKKDSLASNTDGVYIGTDGIALGANSKFKALSDGTLYAEKGYLGGTNGFVLETKKIYNGKSTFSDTSNGVYIGTDGIALGADNVFSVTTQGYITAKYGSIGGAVITNNSIHASNNNWWISSDGSASFKNVTITGNSTFGSSVDNPFSGTTVTHINNLVVGTVTSDYVYSKAIQAGFITADTISANYATIDKLNALSAKIDSIEADYITSTELSANYATITNLNSVDAKFDNLNADNITSGTINVQRLDLDYLFGQEISGRVIGVNTLQAAIRVSAEVSMNAPDIRCTDFACDTINFHSVSWETITVDGKSYTVLTGSYNDNLYLNEVINQE